MKRIYIQLFLILILIIISILLFLKYFNKTYSENSFKENINQTIDGGESVIEDLKYLSTDKEGNEYRIEAQKGNIDKNNPDVIFLENVKKSCTLTPSLEDVGNFFTKVFNFSYNLFVKKCILLLIQATTIRCQGFSYLRL